jgi:hypothetical protein
VAGLSSVDAADLATYLNDSSLNVERASMMIADAQAACEMVVSPLPDGAAFVVRRVAARAYLQTSARQYQLGAADSTFGGAPSMAGGVYLTQTDRRDLRAASGGGGAFSIDVLPASYSYTPPWWGSAGDVAGDWDAPT